MAPPSLAPIAARVRGYDSARLLDAMRLVGLETAGPPITVMLVEEGSPEALSAPSWATGYARGNSGVIVLIPSRAQTYPYGSLESLLHHEVTHVLIDRAAAGRPVPRWFHEGLAMAAARAWDLEDRTRLIIEMIPGRSESLDEIDTLFGMGAGPANRAYALSGAFVRDLLAKYGPSVPGEILAGAARGVSFDDAFLRTTGMSLDAATLGFYRRQNLWNRWIPFLTSGFTIWTTITLLAIWAIRRRRARDAMKREQWALEEAMIEPLEPIERFEPRKDWEN